MANNYFALLCADYKGAPQYIKFAQFIVNSMSSGNLAYNSNECFSHLLNYGTDLRVLLDPDVIPLKASPTVSSSDNIYYFQILNLDNRYLGIAISHTQNNDYYRVSYRIYSKDNNNNYIRILNGYAAIDCYCVDCSDNYIKYISLFMPQIAYAEYNNDKIIGTFELRYDYHSDPDIGGNFYSSSALLFKIPQTGSYNISNYTFDEVFGDSVILPSYPSGGVEPVDVFGGDENNFDSTSDDIAVPTVIEGAIDNGLVKSYLISPAQLNTMMADLTNFDNVTLTNFLDHISMLYNNPIDAIISIKKFCIDFSEVPIGDAENVRLIGFQTSATANPITSQYKRVDVGSIDIAEFFGGFLDYPPYTRCSIYLPFIGEKELNVQEIMDSTIHLYYMVDFLTGNCVAHLNVEKSAGETNLNSDLYQWEGNMSCDVPLTANDFHQILGNFTKNAVLDLTSGITANVGGIIEGFGGMIGSVTTGKVMSGAISGSSALMGVRVPYIKIENPIQTVPDNFQELRGLAGNINHIIGNLSGFLRCREVDINNITATDDEKAELYGLLTGGIFI